MKRGTASRVILGKNTIAEMPGGVFVGTDVILGKKDGLTNDFNGLVLSNTVMFGKKVSHAAIISVIVRGANRIVLPDAIANSLSYVKAFGGTEQRSVPAGYTQLAYIGSAGTQYIDLGYKGNGNTKVDVKFKYHTVSSSTGSGRVFGSRTSSTSNAFAVGTSSGIVAETTNALFWCYDNQPYFQSDENFGLNVWKTVVFSATEHSIDGVSIGNDYEIVEFETPQNLKLFGFDNNGSMGVGYVDIAYCKLWDNGVLVRDLVPARRDSDNALGMYDTVSGAFLTNDGTGTFTAGPTAVPTPDAPMDIVCNNGVLRIQGSATGTGTQAGDPTPTTPIYPVFYQKGNLVLRAVGEYADTYDAATQTITRNVGVKVLDGTENDYAKRSDYAINYTGLTGRAYGAGVYGMCSHFVCSANNASTAPVGSLFFNVSNIYLHFFTEYGGDVTSFKSWLASQYAAGTPVIVYYPLATPITESFTPSAYADGTVETIGVHGTNLLDLANCTDGYYYTPAGEYTATPNARLSNYIPVKASVTYTVGLMGEEGQANVRINLFDTAKNWLAQTVFASFAGEERAQTITPTQDGFLAFSANYLSSSRVDWNTAQVVQGSYTVATMPEYQPYYDGGTATAEMLLKVGDYQDVQSILDGVVTRNVGVKVLDGTEDWSRNDTRTSLVLDDSAIGTSNWGPYCTHYQSFVGGVSINNMPDNSCKINVNQNNFLIKDATHNTDLATWKQYLANQYAAGTPVIVVYPLATETTESVAGQALQVTGGDNVLEITQASLTGLELEAQYNTLVQLTVQEVENANLDNDVTVTIQ